MNYSDMEMLRRKEEGIAQQAAAESEDAYNKVIRRELAAIAMQGILSNPNNTLSKGEVTFDAIAHADSLLDRLSKG